MAIKPDATKARKSIPYIQIVMTMLAESGLHGVREMRPGPTKHSLARAVLYLGSHGNKAKADELSAYIKRQYPPKKSKTRPQTGDVRIYMTHDQDNIRYVRIPVEALGATKGSHIQAVFEEDRITLRHLKMDEPLKHVEARKAQTQKRPRK